MNGDTNHSTSPKRYSARSSAAVPPRRSLVLGVTSKAPAPTAMRGGSAGEPTLSCALATDASAPSIAINSASIVKTRPVSRQPVIDIKRTRQYPHPDLPPQAEAEERCQWQTA